MSDLLFCICLLLMFFAGAVSGYNICDIRRRNKYHKLLKQNMSTSFDKIIEEGRKIMAADGWRMTGTDENKEQKK